MVQEAPTDLHFSGVQINQPSGGNALYVDGMVTNAGKGRVSAATAQVDFYDGRGTLVASIQSPLVGVAEGGTDMMRNEFARNPIGPGEMRFFRVAVERVPSDWNHEAPALKPVAVRPP